MNLSIKKFLSSRTEFGYLYINSSKKFCEKLWWRFMPGTTVSVRWPMSAISADPNEFYRPYLEQNVGQQGWDWNWDIIGNDAPENRLSIKIRRGKSKWASIIGVMWS